MTEAPLSSGPSAQTTMALETENDKALARAFEMRHPGLALAWNVLKRSPLKGSLVVLAFLIVSGVVIEAGSLIYKRVNSWVDQNWVGQWVAHDREVATDRVHAEAQAKVLRIGHELELAAPIPFYAEHNAEFVPTGLPTIEQLLKRDPDLLTRSPQIFGAGQRLWPVFRSDSTMARVGNYVIATTTRTGDVYGLIPLKEYQAAGLPQKWAAQSKALLPPLANLSAGPRCDTSYQATMTAAAKSGQQWRLIALEAVGALPIRRVQKDGQLDYQQSGLVCLIWLPQDLAEPINVMALPTRDNVVSVTVGINGAIQQGYMLTSDARTLAARSVLTEDAPTKRDYVPELGGDLNPSLGSQYRDLTEIAEREADKDAAFEARATDAMAGEVAEREATKGEKLNGYIAALSQILLLGFFIAIDRLAKQPQPKRIALLREQFSLWAATPVDRLKVGGRWWQRLDGEWHRINWNGREAALVDPKRREHRQQEEVQQLRGRHSAMRAIYGAALIGILLAAVWGWGLDSFVVDLDDFFVDVDPLAPTERLLHSETVGGWLLTLWSILLLVATLIIGAWEYAYRMGWQTIPGAMVLDPEPLISRREEVEKQKAHGGARLATESETLATAGVGAGRRSAVHDQEF